MLIAEIYFMVIGNNSSTLQRVILSSEVVHTIRHGRVRLFPHSLVISLRSGCKVPSNKKDIHILLKSMRYNTFFKNIREFYNCIIWRLSCVFFIKTLQTVGKFSQRWIFSCFKISLRYQISSQIYKILQICIILHKDFKSLEKQ